MNAKDCYDELASHYHLIFENWEASMERQAAVLGAILERECGGPDATCVLDCACGIGTQALGLARLGFRVRGCDVSSAAVERARREACERGLELQLSVANMLDLTALADSDFDAVICMDNALPHLENAEQLVQAAALMRKRLRPGGLLMASTRDYDQLIKVPSCRAPTSIQIKAIAGSFFNFGTGSMSAAMSFICTSRERLGASGRRFTPLPLIVLC